jgi:hypothetical protein
VIHSQPIQPLQSTRVIKEKNVEIQGIGHFTIKSNGHVQVLFEDRTMIQMDQPLVVQSPDACATLTTPCGECFQIRLAKPIGYEW